MKDKFIYVRRRKSARLIPAVVRDGKLYIVKSVSTGAGGGCELVPVNAKVPTKKKAKVKKAKVDYTEIED